MRTTRAIKKGFLFSIIPFFCCSCASKNIGGTTFHFASYKTAEPVAQKIFFEDEYFSLPASTYQTHLATASACLALAGFSSTINDYGKSSTNANKLFDSLGFDTFAVNEFGNAKPTAHSFGVYMAKKTIEDYTLLGITVRGAGYQMEWASNVSVGKNDGVDYDEDFATGFSEASDIYIDFVKRYIANNSITGKIKIWTAGYSRGGASVNLAIGKIDDALVNGDLILPNVTYAKDDLYAYCFEPPAGKVFDPSIDAIKYKGENYNNIHCILNLNDMVPFVAPKEFGFIRYGVDHYLPDIVSDLDYAAHIKRVKKQIQKLPNYLIVGDYKIDKFIKKTSLSTKSIASDPSKRNWTMGRFLSSFIKELADAMNGRDGYADNFEVPLSKLFQIVYKNGSPKDSFIDVAIKMGERMLILDPDEIVLDDLINNRSRFFQDLRPILQTALERSGVVETIDIEEVIDLIKTLCSVLLNLVDNTGLDLIPSFFLKDNIAGLASAHYPELLLCHMKAMDSNYVDGELNTIRNSYTKIVISKTGYHKIKINGDEIGSYSKNSFSSDVVAEETNDSIIYYLESDKQYQIIALGDDIDVSIYRVDPTYVNDVEVLNTSINKDSGPLTL